MLWCLLWWPRGLCIGPRLLNQMLLRVWWPETLSVNILLRLTDCAKLFCTWCWRAISCSVLIDVIPNLISYLTRSLQATASIRNISVMWRKLGFESWPEFLILPPTLEFTFCGSKQKTPFLEQGQELKAQSLCLNRNFFSLSRSKQNPGEQQTAPLSCSLSEVSPPFQTGEAQVCKGRKSNYIAHVLI